MKPFFTFYGGKYRAAPHYPTPIHDMIIEPFAGSAGYSVRYFDRKILLIEKDPKIAGLWKYLTKVSQREIMGIPLQISNTVDDMPICEEAKWLVGFWCNKGASAPMKSPSKWMRGGTRPNSYWGAVTRARIAEQVTQIRHWRVVEGSYETAPNIRATWYIDPPYAGAGNHYRMRINNYELLAEWCRTRRGQVMVCENVGATWLPFEPFRLIKSNPSCRGKSVSAEALYYDYRVDDVGAVTTDLGALAVANGKSSSPFENKRTWNGR